MDGQLRDRAETARLDYLALGDWHALSEVNPRTYYSGTPEPDKHKVGERGQVLAVSIAPKQAAKVEAVKTAHYDWPLISVKFEAERVSAQLDALRGQVREGHPLRQTHVRLDISGEITVSDWALFEDFAEEMAGECASFDVRGAQNVRLVVVPEDIEALDAQGSVREAAETLTARSNDPDLSRADRQIASDALRLLFSYAGETA